MTEEQKVFYYPSKVAGSLKEGSLILSNSIPIPDSLLSVIIMSDEMKAFFENQKTNDALLRIAEKTRSNKLLLFLIHLNNAVQNHHLSDEDKTIFLKEITTKVESLSTLDHFENSFSHAAVALK